MIQFGNMLLGKLKISKNDAKMWLFLVMLTLPHLKPPYFERVPVLDLISNIWRIASFAVFILWAMFFKRKVSAIVVLIGIRELFILAVTAFRQGDVYIAAATSFSVLSVIALYEFANDDRRTLISSQLFCFELMVYINLFTEILYPNGLYSEGNGFVYYTKFWFLGLYNTHTKYYFPALLFAWLYKETTGRSIRAYFLLAAIIVASIRVWSGGTLLSLGLMIIVYALFKNRTRVFNYYNYWALHIVFFVLVVLLKMQNYFIWLLDGILKKWSSLIVRMNLWEEVIKLIHEAPIIGHGIRNGIARTIESGISFGSHAHNLVLEIMYQGGVINLVFWILIVVIAGAKVYQHRDSTESKIIATAFLGWCIHTLVEPYSSPFLMGMFVIAYHSSRGKESVPIREGRAAFVKL